MVHYKYSHDICPIMVLNKSCHHVTLTLKHYFFKKSSSEMIQLFDLLCKVS